MDEPTRQGLFEIMKEYLEFLEGTSEAQMNHVRGAAWKLKRPLIREDLNVIQTSVPGD